MTDKCRHDGLRGMDFTNSRATQYPSRIANGVMFGSILG